MTLARTAAVASGLFILPSSPFARGNDPQKVAFFETHIRPVLVDKCLSCHSVEAESRGKLKGGLYLDTREGLLTGGGAGPAIVPGDPEKSLLIEAIRHKDEDFAMPPKEDKLPAAVIAAFEQWIKDGAVDPRDGAAPLAKKRGMSIEEGRNLWSIIPPRSSPSPKVARKDWARSDVDHYVLARLEEQQLTPADDADANSLVRRLYFDVIGLPPAPDEVAAFVAAAKANRQSAIESLVDRLLASPRFGERWGRHWLDSVRYADSNGRDRNVVFYHAWRYRDYVLDSFQRDKPYDQFIREQIAGDLLPAKDAAHRDELRIATGFLALGPKAFEEQKPEIFRMDVIDEQIDVISRSMLGLTVSCARCHDHKFDPIPTADYYALAGILRSTQPLYGWGTRGIKATAFHHTEWQAVGSEAETLAPAAQEYYKKLQAETLALFTARSDRYRVVRNISGAKLDIKKPDADQEKLTADIARMEAEVKDWDIRVKAMEKAWEELKDTAPPQPGWAMAAREREKMENARIHIRGETTNLGPEVPRGVLQAIAIEGVPVPAEGQSGRLPLAHWLSHRDNPLTARVYVNRVWQKLFGRAIVATPDDFGVNGEKPTHPELLDHLAIRFMENGWSIKTLIRELLLTRVYGLSTVAMATNLERDPDNVYLWRMPPRRLEAENLRDAILAVSGQLDLNPPEKPFLSRYHPQRDAELMSFKPFLTPADLVDHHRSVYLPVVRGTLPELFQLFDFASPDRPVAQRDESVVPAQALYLMNNPWVMGQAKHTALRLMAVADRTESQRVAELFQLAFARSPNTMEAARAEAFLAGADELLPDPKSNDAPEPEAMREARWTSLCQVIFASAEFSLLR